MTRLSLLYTLFFLIVSCAGTNSNVPKKPSPAPLKKVTYSGPPVVLAILDFENNSITDVERLDPLRQGFAGMLSTDLGKFEAIKIVERAKIQAMIQELELSQTGIVGESTAVQVGKMVGAKNIVFGSFIVINGQMRVDVRMIEVETSLLVVAEEMSGPSDSFLHIEKELVQKIVAGLNVKTSGDTESKALSDSKESFQAAIFYSRGVEFMDEKKYPLAKKMFQKALEADPHFEAAQKHLESDLFKNQ
ncbi:MAG: CsgG/HfaB family protein [Nitrospinota bacterium]